ncbi:MAG: class II aldolase/adducin family protein [Planctomycetota bacterium]|jgi:rhamnose utilization protein RhaD (predicted bifunctional aldolase and dehydrogenase)|nr:class II aldolase/adducin family protein [Planctomycetota bacterium]
MDTNQLLDAIAGLSQEFGQETYVRGGGGNTSCKTKEVLFIKPSGITLAEMTPDKFAGLDRVKLDKLFGTAFPDDVNKRESAVLEFISATVLPERKGRPSVEAPLHHCFPQTFVVHTHPAVVNGLTCSRNGPEICARLFPNAMWLPVIEPGYTLGVRVHGELKAFAEKNGKSPDMLFLANHGVFIGGNTEADIRARYNEVMTKLGAEIEKAGLSGNVDAGPAPDRAVAEKAVEGLRKFMGDDAACWSVRGRFPIYEQPLTPDHIVYCRSHMYDGDGSEASLTAFKNKYGYWPKVVGLPGMVLGLGATQRPADLASELAFDAANVVRFTGAFGGVKFLNQHFIDFIENWEVESYRQKVAK